MPVASLLRLLHCHLWPVPLYHIFPHYLTNGTMFGEKLVNILYNVRSDFLYNSYLKHLSF